MIVGVLPLPQPEDLTSLVLRIDFTDDAAWAEIQAVLDGVRTVPVTSNDTVGRVASTTVSVTRAPTVGRVAYVVDSFQGPVTVCSCTPGRRVVAALERELHAHVVDHRAGRRRRNDETHVAFAVPGRAPVAIEELHTSDRRLVQELFWFWPIEESREPDPAVPTGPLVTSGPESLAQGDRHAAAPAWETLVDSTSVPPVEVAAAVHNLADPTASTAFRRGPP